MLNSPCSLVGYSTSESWESKGSFLQCTGFTYYFRRWGQSRSWRISWSFWSPCGKGECLIRDIAKVLTWILYYYNGKYSCLDNDQMKCIFKNLLFLLHKPLSSLVDFYCNSVPSFLLLFYLYQWFGFFFVFCFVFLHSFPSVICKMVSY